MPHSNADESGPLKVLVAGGGIGGLSAAIFLRRQGHQVEIFESSGFSSETGAAIHIPSNVNGLLRKAGLIPEKYGAVDVQWVSEYLPTGDLKFTMPMASVQEKFPYPWQFIHRVDLHSALREIAISKDGQGPPAILHLKSRVKSVNTDAPSITLEDGSTQTGDLIIGADGIHSRIRQSLLPNLPPPAASGSNAFRFLIPTEIVRSTPEIAHFVEKPGELRLHYAEDRRLVVYPCRDNTLLNFVAMHPDEETDASSEEWNQSASKELLLSCYKSFPADVQTLLTKADPESIKLWKLLDHEELGRENWVHGKVVMIGDAAHAFLPHQGQGGAQAIEDGAALGALLPRGTPAADIPHRLELFIKARYDRATQIQEFTRQAAIKTSTAKSGHGGKVLNPMQFTDFNMNHDAHDHARGILLRDTTQRARYRRMPLSFGPSPGPRQDLRGRPRQMGDFGYKTSYVTFRTTKSYLSTLLPTDDFSFATDGAWATATFAVTELSKLKWLGGRGYSMFGLYIHDVQVAPAAHSENKEVMRGDFLPVLFENMADPIITGREELGFAKVFATIESSSPSSNSNSNSSSDSKSTTDAEFSIGWQGTPFCTLTLHSLTLDPSAPPALQTPALHYKSIPSSVSAEVNDADYVLRFPALPCAEGEVRWRAVGGADIKFTELEGEELEGAFPTLAGVVEGLRGVGIREVLACGVQSSP